MKVQTLPPGYQANLGPATRLEAPATMVEQFNSLMGGVKASLEGGKTTLAQRNAKQVPLIGNMLDEASFTVNRAEVSINAFEKEIRKSVHDMAQDDALNQGTIEEIVYQKTVSNFSHVGIMIMGNKANDINEEVSSLTKGR
jgi:hypothetical protein